MIKIVIRVEIERETNQSLNHLTMVTDWVVKSLERYRPVTMQTIEIRVLGSSIKGVHNKIFATFPCGRVIADAEIRETE